MTIDPPDPFQALRRRLERAAPFVSVLTGEAPVAVELFEHVYPGLLRVLLVLPHGDVEVQDHDGVRAVAHMRLTPLDFELLDRVRERLLAGVPQ